MLLYLSVLRQIPPFAWPSLARDRFVASKRAVPEQVAEAWSNARFSSDWYSDNAGHLAHCLKGVTVADFLEVGAWEGRSTLFFLSMFPRARGVVVDVWWGPHGPSAKSRFNENVAPHRNRLTVLEKPSNHALPLLDAEGKKFDLIHIDGDHRGDAVLLDAINAVRMLRVGGVLVFDDFLFNDAEWSRAQQPWYTLSVFLRMYAGQLRVMRAGYQLVLQRIAGNAPESPNLPDTPG